MRLSDFQIPDARMPVDEKLMARNAKAARTQVDWKKTRTSATPGANQPFISLLMDGAAEETESNEPVGEALGVGEGFANVAKQVVGGAAQNLASAALMESDKSHSALRKKIHDALDKMLDAEAERNSEQDPDPNYPLHDPNAELDAQAEENAQYREARVHSESDEEPESDSDEEPAEEMDAKAAFDNFLIALTSSASTLKNAAKHRASAMDGLQLRLGKPEDNARDAVGKFGVGFDVNTSERLPWFELLCAWIHKQPKETKVKDLSQPKLQYLLRQMYEAA
jgi:hypothetical protein